MPQKQKFRFSQKTKLPTKPLIEAWLEVRWKLADDKTNPNLKRDPEFEIAVLNFYQRIKSEFPQMIALDNSRIPIELAPYLVRFQFKKDNDGWPLIQFGSGVATLNFTTSYTWTDFKKYAEFLRNQLTKTYTQQLESELFVLRYRNAFLFNYSTESLSQFLNNNLNLSIGWPKFIPGSAGDITLPKIALDLGFDLKDNIGAGKIKIQLGKKKEKDEKTGQDEEKESVVVDVELATETPPNLYDPAAYKGWLNTAHNILHEWFLCLIEGPLLKEYQGE